MDFKIIELNGITLKVFENGTILVKKKDDFYEKKCNNRNGYLDLELCLKKKRKHYKIHRIIAYAFLDLDIKDTSKIIDHIDRNPLNNNVSNLRIVTQQQNTFNTNAKGYRWHKRDKKWQARIKLNGKEIHLGYYDNEEDASKAYQAAKLIYHMI